MATLPTVYSQNWHHMKFHSSYVGSLAAMCSKESSRYDLRAPHLDVVKQVIVATNGNALVVVPVTVNPEETSGLVDLRALKFYVKAHKIWRKNKLSFNKHNQPAEPSLMCGEKVVFLDSDGTRMEYVRTGKEFPKWDEVLPDFKGRQVCINPAYLRDLAISMKHDWATDGVVLWIPDDKSKGIGVSSLTRTNFGMGVLMPMRGGDEKAPSLKTMER